MMNDFEETEMLYFWLVFLTVSVYAYVTTHFLDHKLEKSNVT